MQIAIQIIPQKSQQQKDLSYWLSRPVAERLAAVETLRLQQHPDLPNQKMQRVYRVLHLRDLADREALGEN